jgi:hypothetical protein
VGGAGHCLGLLACLIRHFIVVLGKSSKRISGGHLDDTVDGVANKILPRQRNPHSHFEGGCSACRRRLQRLPRVHRGQAMSSVIMCVWGGEEHQTQAGGVRAAGGRVNKTRLQELVSERDFGFMFLTEMKSATLRQYILLKQNVVSCQMMWPSKGEEGVTC